MDERNSKTSSNGFVLAETCLDVEDRIVDSLAASQRREELVRRARSLRREFQSWAERPPDKTLRFERWMELVALEIDAEDAGAPTC